MLLMLLLLLHCSSFRATQSLWRAFYCFFSRDFCVTCWYLCSRSLFSQHTLQLHYLHTQNSSRKWPVPKNECLLHTTLHPTTNHYVISSHKKQCCVQHGSMSAAFKCCIINSKRKPSSNLWNLSPFFFLGI